MEQLPFVWPLFFVPGLNFCMNRLKGWKTVVVWECVRGEPKQLSLTAWIRFSPAAEVQPQAGLNLASSDTAPWLMGWICPAWNLKNRLFLVLSSLWCLLRIWPFGRSVCWCTQESCRWVGIWAKSSNTSQPCSYLKEQHLLICLWQTGCHFAMAFYVALSLLSVWGFLLGPKSSCQI